MRRQHSDALFSVRLSLLYHVFLSSSRLEEDSFEEPLSHRRQKNKRAEEELHHISEKLSHRLEELDQVCMCVYCVRSQHIILNVLYPSKSNFNPSCMCVSLFVFRVRSRHFCITVLSFLFLQQYTLCNPCRC